LSCGYDTTIGTVVKEKGCAPSETKYDWAKTHARDPQLAQELEVKALPSSSVANMCEFVAGNNAPASTFA